MPKTTYKPCELAGCVDAQVARGYCWKHYQRLRSHGSPRRFATQYVTNADPCSVAGCDRDPKARGWCNLHYKRWRTHGSADDPRPSFEGAFWAKVDKDGPEVRPGLGPCWVWTAACNSDGYGSFRSQVASRVVLELVGRPIPGELEAAHHCDNPPCVNPDHIFQATHAENMADMARKGRRRGETALGGGNPAAKLADEEIAAIRERYEEGGASQRELALRYGVSQRQIGRIVRGEDRLSEGATEAA